MVGIWEWVEILGKPVSVQQPSQVYLPFIYIFLILSFCSVYFEFVSYSTVGFGDLVPSDEVTVGGAIGKGLLIRIPGCILLASLILRLWPIIIIADV